MLDVDNIKIIETMLDERLQRVVNPVPSPVAQD